MTLWLSRYPRLVSRRHGVPRPSLFSYIDVICSVTTPYWADQFYSAGSSPSRKVDISRLTQVLCSSDRKSWTLFGHSHERLAQYMMGWLARTNDGKTAVNYVYSSGITTLLCKRATKQQTKTLSHRGNNSFVYIVGTAKHAT